jgi:hypothetical protein
LEKDYPSSKIISTTKIMVILAKTIVIHEKEKERWKTPR